MPFQYSFFLAWVEMSRGLPWNRISPSAHYIPGEGKMPLRELMRDIIDRGYEGYCTVELVTMYMNEPRLYARQALERFRALLPEDER